MAESASVNLEVKVQDFPKDKNVTFSNLQIGQPANLSLKMDIYPEPKNEDYDWTIYDKSTNTKIEVKTGMHWKSDAIGINLKLLSFTLSNYKIVK